MSSNFDDIVTRMNDADLEKYVVVGANYVPDAVESALGELQKRGRIFGQDELDQIHDHLNQKRSKADLEKENIEFSNSDINKVTQQHEVPLYYSRVAVFVFSLLFSTAIGSFLLGSNINKTGNKTGFYIVIIFGILYVVLQAIVFALIPIKSTGITYVTGVIGSLILDRFFWPKYIGMETIYTTKPIWKPLIISMLIIIPLMLIVMIYGK